MIKKLLTTTSTSTPTAMTFGPTAVLTDNNQILQLGRVSPVGTDGKPVTGIPVPFGAPGIMMRRAIPVNMRRGL